MPLREYKCPTCKQKREFIDRGAPEVHFCPGNNCGDQMDIVEWSVPAKTRVGKYGKGGGLPPEGHDG